LFSIIWTLCNAISLLLTGRLSDKFGRRWFLLVAGAVAIIGGIVAATAKTMNTLIGANVWLPSSISLKISWTLTAEKLTGNIGYHWLGFGCSFFAKSLCRRSVTFFVYRKEGDNVN
jgi:MFS family permease